MSQAPPVGPPPSGGKKPTTPLPESKHAEQKPSEGGLLTSKSWSWRAFFSNVFSLQWWVALFQPAEKPKSVETISTSGQGRGIEVMKKAQNLLSGRIQPPVMEDLSKLIEQAPTKWINDFETFLDTAQNIEEQKPGQYHLLLQSDLAQELKEKHLPLLEEEIVKQNPWLNSLIQEILFVTVVNNTQKMGEALKPVEGRTSTIFKASYTKPPPFALQLAIPTEEPLVCVCDPLTKETRTIRVSSDKKEHAMQFAKAVYDLSHPQFEEGTFKGNLSDKDLRSKWLSQGNIYVIEYEKRTFLSLCPRLVDSDRSNIPPKCLAQIRELIRGGKEGTIQMPIGVINPEDVKAKVHAEKTDEGSLCVVELSYNGNTYTIKYPMNPDETLEKLEPRIVYDRSLERDLLLARSYFVRKGIQHEQTSPTRST